MLCHDCGSSSPRSTKRKRHVESSEEEVPDDSESQNGDDESESPKPVRCVVLLHSKTCDNIWSASRRKEKLVSDVEEEEESDEDNEEEVEDDESSGQEVSDSEGDNSDEEKSGSGEDSDASDVTKDSDPFIDNKSRYVVCGVAWALDTDPMLACRRERWLGKAKSSSWTKARERRRRWRRPSQWRSPRSPR